MELIDMICDIILVIVSNILKLYSIHVVAHSFHLYISDSGGKLVKFKVKRLCVL